MKTWASAATYLTCLACLLSAGCNAPRRRVSHLEDEMRRLESTLWDKQYELEESQREIDDLRAKLGKRDGLNLPPIPITSPSDPGYDRPEAPPVITLPDEPMPPGQMPDRFRLPTSPDSSGGEAPSFQAPEILPPSEDGFDVPTPSTSRSPSLNSPTAPVPQDSILSTRFSAAQISSVTLDSGLLIDDDGLTVVVQPRDAEGQIVSTPGPISVVLIDPTLAGQGDVARVARWDFTAEQVAQMWAAGSQSLKMAWSQSRPSNERLHAFVRYTTGDGLQLQADREITIPTADPAWQHNPMASPAPISPASPPPPIQTATRPTWSPTR